MSHPHEVRFDHAVIVVADLARSSRDFAAAGFTVVPGGAHEEIPTENALIAFPDGGYLELLAVRDAGELADLRRRHPSRAGPLARRFLPYLSGVAGVADFAVACDGASEVTARLAAAGHPADGPVAMTRRRRDGTLLSWRLALPRTAALPFVIEDVTPRDLRVPADEGSRTHANGARGVAGIVVRAANPEATARAYSALGGGVVAEDAGARAWIGGVEITFESGTPEGACAIALIGGEDEDPPRNLAAVRVSFRETPR